MTDQTTTSASGVTRSGRCLCGAVQFSAMLKTDETGAISVDVCHCGMCRRCQGGPAFGVETLEPPRYESSEKIGLYRGSGWGERGFCTTCGSSLFWRLQDQSYTNIPAGLLDDQTGLTLSSEIFVDDQPDFYALAGERTRMTGAEVIAAFTSNN